MAELDYFMARERALDYVTQGDVFTRELCRAGTVPTTEHELAVTRDWIENMFTVMFEPRKDGHWPTMQERATRLHSYVMTTLEKMIEAEVRRMEEDGE